MSRVGPLGFKLSAPLAKGSNCTHKVFSVSNDRNISSDKYISKLNYCGWLQAVADNLTCAANVAKCVHCEGTQGMHIVMSLRIYFGLCLAGWVCVLISIRLNSVLPFFAK